jgi:GNAT superfamily N-acetyltransferase
MNSEPLIRKLDESDLAGAMALVRAVGWNQTEQDWRHILELEPGGALALEAGGQVASTATTVCYGRDLAWIGMVLTLPECRGRGYARRLMEKSLAWAERRGILWTKLDATDMGHHLYESLGFRDEQPVERWKREPAGGDFSAPELAFAMDAELDRQAFGADRARLLDFFRRFEATSVPGRRLLRPLRVPESGGGARAAGVVPGPPLRRAGLLGHPAGEPRSPAAGRGIRVREAARADAHGAPLAGRDTAD